MDTNKEQHNPEPQPRPELEIIQVEREKKERDIAREVNIQTGYSDDLYEKCIIHPVTNTTLH